MKRRILLVDDELPILLTLRAILEMNGFEVETAASAREAEGKLAAGDFHMVITDMRMETETAGYDVIRCAKQQKYNPAVAILTAYPSSGSDWKTRGKRTDEYIAAMRTLWRDDAAEFSGPTVQFRDAYMYPRPVRPGGIPIMVGGDSEIAQKRVARSGDGWLAFDMPVAEAPARIARLKQLTREQDRDPESLRISVAIFTWTEPDELERYRDAGVTEFLGKPITARGVVERITQVVEHARSFVRTENYFGPDRRRRVDPHYSGPFRRATDTKPEDDED